MDGNKIHSSQIKEYDLLISFFSVFFFHLKKVNSVATLGYRGILATFSVFWQFSAKLYFTVLYLSLSHLPLGAGSCFQRKCTLTIVEKKTKQSC